MKPDDFAARGGPRSSMARAARAAGALALIAALAIALIASRADHASAPSAAPERIEPAAEGEGEAVQAAVYSPFVIRFREGSGRFRVASFKDVGAKLAPAQREALYESLAESLAFELSADPELSWPGRVAYDESILDPASHLACGASHLYVDLWRSSDPERWGYSLWSGCGEEDNFAWSEVEARPSPKGDLLGEVEPLSRQIASSLREANARACFRRSC